jgi:D-galactarolactone cycloisomerase
LSVLIEELGKSGLVETSTRTPSRGERGTDVIPPTDGTVAVPNGPGIGIDIDETAVDRYRID